MNNSLFFKHKGEKLLLTGLETRHLTFLKTTSEFSYSHEKFSVRQFLRLFLRVSYWKDPVTVVKKYGIYHIQDGHYRYLLFKLFKAPFIKVALFYQPDKDNFFNQSALEIGKIIHEQMEKNNMTTSFKKENLRF